MLLNKRLTLLITDANSLLFKYYQMYLHKKYITHKMNFWMKLIFTFSIHEIDEVIEDMLYRAKINNTLCNKDCNIQVK